VVDFPSARRNFPGRELVHGSAQNLDGVAVVEVERRKIQHELTFDDLGLIER